MAHEGFGAALFDDLHGARPRVEIIGNSRVVVENHRRRRAARQVQRL